MSLKSVPYQSSNTGTFYFAFGSNLFPAQMKARMTHDPKSSKPIATARLRDYSWYISDRGYANVASLPLPTSTSSTTTKKKSTTTIQPSTTLPTSTTPSSQPRSPSPNINNKPNRTTTPPSTYIDGLLYNLHPDDEKALDKYEGYDSSRVGPENPDSDPAERRKRPFLQGRCSYNKLYLEVEVLEWFDGSKTGDFGVVAGIGNEDENGGVDDGRVGRDDDDEIKFPRVLVYVDEIRTKPGRIWDEYVARMSVGVTFSVLKAGIDRHWIESVMGCYGIRVIEKVEFDGDGKGWYTGQQPGSGASERDKEEWEFVGWVRGLVSRNLFE